MPQISKMDFDAWWSSPVAIEFKRMLKEDLDKLAYGTMTPAYARDAIGNAIEIGRFESLRFLHDLTYEQFMGEQ